MVRTVSLLLALGASSLACNPRSFDELTGRDPAGAMDAQVPQLDASNATDAGSEAAAPGDAAHDASTPSRCEPPLPVEGLAQVEEALELGVLPTPPTLTERRGSVSARVGERLVWLFSETIIPGQASAFPSAVWGRAEGGPEHAKQARFDELPGAPASLVDSAGLVLPGGLIPRADGSLLVFYVTYYIFTPVQAWVARLEPDSVVAATPDSSLFSIAPEPPPDAGQRSRWRPLFYNGAHVADGFVYLYACNAAPGEEQTSPCRLARAPLDGAEDQRAYRFYSGREAEPWVDDQALAVPVLDGVANDLSVSYNAYLGRLLAVFISTACPGQIELHVADRAEGPWTRIGTVATRTPPPAAAGALNYRAFEHPALRSEKEDEIVLSYVHYLALSFDPPGSEHETRLVRVKLRQ